MVLLLSAQIVVTAIPFRFWRERLGAKGIGEPRGEPGLVKAEQLAANVEWAASRLPFTTKCLPRAMALSWMLRRHGIAHSVVFAARPEPARRDSDSLHAWVEVAGSRVIGDLPGPWMETLRLGDEP
jgi:hypothetical protein